MWKRNLQEYLEQIRVVGKPATPFSMIEDTFYVMEYEFSLDYDERVVATFDLFPLFYKIGLDTKNQNFIGLNFHHLPVKIRQLILDTAFNNPTTLNKLTYNIAKSMIQQKVHKCVRNYKFERIRWIRKINTEEANKLIMYASNTYLDSSYADMVRRYKQRKSTYK
jgi:hypothetical protein